MSSGGDERTTPGGPATLVVHPSADRPEMTSALEDAARDAVRRCPGPVAIETGDGTGPPAVPALTLRTGSREVAHWLAVPIGPEGPPFAAAVERAAEGHGETTVGDTVRIEVFVAADCPNCPRAVDAALRLADSEPTLAVTIIDAQAFPELAGAVPVRSVPTTIIDGALTFVGEVSRRSLAEAVSGRTASPAAILKSLVDTGRLDAAVTWLLDHRSAAAFAEVWRATTMEQRIGLTLIADGVVDADPEALADAVPLLIAVLDTADVAHRGDTADLLGRIADPRARPALDLLRTDPDPDVAEAAADAIEAIDGT